MATLLNSVTGKYFEAGADQAVWDDLVVSLLGLDLQGAGYPDLDTFEGGLKAISFPPGTDTSLYFQVQLPHAWLEGSTIHPHLHFMSTSAENKRALFTFGYCWFNAIEAASPLEIQDPQLTQPLDTATASDMLVFTPIDGSGKTISSLIVCRITRDGTDPTDDYTGDVFGISFDFHIQLDKDGSRTATAI